MAELGWFAPMLGHEPDRTPDVFETLAPLLADRGHPAITASRETSSVRRAIDLRQSLHRHRRELDVAIVHIYSGRYFLVVDRLVATAKAAGLPVVGVMAGGGLPALAQRHPRWVRRVLGRLDVLVAPSPYLARLAEGLGRTATVIPNPLDVEAIEFRQRTTVRPRLLWMRAHHEIYDPVGAVRVVEHLVTGGIDARLTMAGGDKGALRQVAAEVDRRGLADRVELTGFVSGADKKGLLADNDIFLNTTTVDNTPVSVLEAAAAGLAIVSTDVGGIPDLLTDGVDALLVPPRSAELMAAAVRKLLDAPPLAASLSSAGRSLAERSAPLLVADSWEALLRRVQAER